MIIFGLCIFNWNCTEMILFFLLKPINWRLILIFSHTDYNLRWYQSGFSMVKLLFLIVIFLQRWGVLWNYINNLFIKLSKCIYLYQYGMLPSYFIIRVIICYLFWSQMLSDLASRYHFNLVSVSFWCVFIIHPYVLRSFCTFWVFSYIAIHLALSLLQPPIL